MRTDFSVEQAKRRVSPTEDEETAGVSASDCSVSDRLAEEAEEEADEEAEEEPKSAPSALAALRSA